MQSNQSPVDALDDAVLVVKGPQDDDGGMVPDVPIVWVPGLQSLAQCVQMQAHEHASHPLHTQQHNHPQQRWLAARPPVAPFVSSPC